MTDCIITLGAGAAPGVPSLSCGWGDCNPQNPKNRRSRTSTYYKLGTTEILVDTSPDLRLQLINNQIRRLDGVLYTHSHADHLHGIDDLREINRISRTTLHLYGHAETMNDVRSRFPYLICDDDDASECLRRPCLVAHDVEHYKPFYVKDVKITPIKLIGHNAPCTGYIFNDGQVVHIADFRHVEDMAFNYVSRRPEILVLPLTTPFGQRFHAGLDDILMYIEKINPRRAVINHMASECDFDAVDKATPPHVTPAWDGMKIEF